MKRLTWISILFVIPGAFAQQAPWARTDIPVSSHDRVYAADQTSNTVSVIDPSSNKLLGVIRLGNPLPGALQPLYTGQLLVPGLGYSPDVKTRYGPIEEAVCRSTTFEGSFSSTKCSLRNHTWSSFVRNTIKLS